METIKNYLESMFRNLQRTEKVIRAKSELLQMMEDKYTELIAEGNSENEAIGTVISEFGNLDELAEDLGISEENTAQKTASEKSRKVSFEEIKDFLNWRMKVPVYRSIGIACCICCVIPAILFDGLRNEIFGAILLFVMIAIGVLLIVFSGKDSQEWDFLKKGPCTIDEKTYQYVAEKKHNFIGTHSIMTAVGIACFILSVVPAIASDYFNSDFAEKLGAAGLFVFVSAGVFLLVYANTVKASLDFVLNINNSKNYFANHKTDNESPYYVPSWESESNENSLKHIKNHKVRALLSVYWLTITCIYLCWSFITFKWHITWIIWPIAGVVYAIINAFAEKTDE